MKNKVKRIRLIPKTIFFKIFISMVGLLVVLISGLYVANNYFFEDFYQNKKIESMIECIQYIENNFDDNIDDIYPDLMALEKKISASIEIKTLNNEIIFPVYAYFFDPDTKTVTIERYGTSKNDDFNYTTREAFVRSGYNLTIDYNEIERTEYISFQMIFMETYIITIRIPMAAISENISIFNEFVLIIGIVLVFVALLIAFIVAKFITKPITNINLVTQGIANFDFSKKCNEKSNDEIGQLAKNINYLSDNLNKSFIELREKNAKLEEDIEKERKIDQMRKTFVSNVSHELRTPISVILGYSEGLTSNVVDSKEDMNFYCSVISDEAIKMNKLVADLLDLSQIEANAYQLVKKKIEIVPVITYILNKFKQLTSEREITITFNQELECYGYYDELRFEQVLTNFLTNAMDHVDEHKIIEITIDELENNYRIGVFNTGKNIPEESIEQIWTHFYKVDKARTRSFGGHGLGLSIVKEIQESHGQSYGCINKENGVYFYFDIEKYTEEEKDEE